MDSLAAMRIAKRGVRQKWCKLEKKKHIEY